MVDKGLTVAVSLISAISTASAQIYWRYCGYGPKARGYCGTPLMAGRNTAAAAATNSATAPAIATPVRRPIKEPFKRDQVVGDLRRH
jgi:hypothetical protein